MSKTFVCEMCRGKFEKIRSEEDALAECQQNFGALPPEELAIVCDDCFNMIMPGGKPA